MSFDVDRFMVAFIVHSFVYSTKH